MRKANFIAMAISAGLAFGAGNAIAGDALSSENLRISACASVGRAAESIMGARQEGFAQSDLLAVYEGRDPRLKKEGFAMVRAAFEEPAYDSEKYRKKAVQEFRDRFEGACLDGALR